jgi:RNase P/RNase MRP subunit p29
MRGEVVEATADKDKDKTVEILVNTKTVEVPKKTTGAEIKAKAGVDPAFQLFRVDGKTEHEVGNDEEITVHTGQVFVATPTLDPS